MQLNYTSQQVACFWQRIDRTAGPDLCWPWLKATNHDGYGILALCNRSWLAHRLAWTLTYGAIPASLFVLHQCDNPPCCNPAHLWLGSRADNNVDKARKGRGAGPRGERAPRARLSAADVMIIRQAHAQGLTGSALARQYGVCASSINRLLRGETWRGVR